MACATHMIHAHCGDREARPASWTRDAAGGNVTERADSIEVALNAAPGCRIVETPVTVLASGQPLVLTTHVLRGAGSGRTVGIVSGLHGDEFSTAELVSLLPLLPPMDIADRCSWCRWPAPYIRNGNALDNPGHGELEPSFSRLLLWHGDRDAGAHADPRCPRRVRCHYRPPLGTRHDGHPLRLLRLHRATTTADKPSPSRKPPGARSSSLPTACPAC